MSTVSASPTVSQSNFPQEITISLEVKILVNSQDELDYYLQANSDPTAPVGSTQLAPTFIADFIDINGDQINGQLVSVNGLTPEQIKKALEKKVGF